MGLRIAESEFFIAKEFVVVVFMSHGVDRHCINELLPVKRGPWLDSIRVTCRRGETSFGNSYCLW
jgi:hypothetical protein